MIQCDLAFQLRDSAMASPPSQEAGAEPACSVVIPTLNAAATVVEALRSLEGQGAPLETIVIDGGSTDGTREAAASWGCARVFLVPGTSIYEAVNLGIGLARAPVIAWLNADDTILPGAVHAAVATLAANPAAMIVRGRAEFVASDGHRWLGPLPGIESRARGMLTLGIVTRGPLAINSMVFRRSVFDDLGPFNAAYRLAADREWVLRAWIAGTGIVETDKPFYRYRVHDGSSTLDPGRRYYLNIRREHAEILSSLLPEVLRRPRGDAIRREILHWHAVEVAMRLVGAWQAGRWADIGGEAARACRTDPAWLLALGRQGMAWMMARMHDRRGDAAS